MAQAIHEAGLDSRSHDPDELTHLLAWLAGAGDPILRSQRLEMIAKSLARRQGAISQNSSGAA
ncbi:hypothetical protein ACQP25_33515 [Microtetraspora malaysiensis]|uniref:hypothetical protein n=1 Tax=Microtetraspora malaysiensis TaxID=161358 RepID=UPI003D8EA1E4